VAPLAVVKSSVRQATGRARGFAIQGFSLVELMIGLTLGLVLLVAVSAAVVRLLDLARISGDHAELAERLRFVSEFLVETVAHSWPESSSSAAVSSPCLDPVVVDGAGLRVVEAGQYPCLPRNNLVPGVPLLVLETVRPCVPACEVPSWPAHFRLTPACGPWVGGRREEIRLLTDASLPADCVPSTARALWQRTVFYIRNYAWEPGDGIASLMMSRFRSDGSGFGRAEMLVPGFVRWRLEPGPGVDFQVLLRAWGRDPVWSPGSLSIWARSSVGVADVAIPHVEARFLALGASGRNAEPGSGGAPP